MNPRKASRMLPCSRRWRNFTGKKRQRNRKSLLNEKKPKPQQTSNKDPSPSSSSDRDEKRVPFPSVPEPVSTSSNSRSSIHISPPVKPKPTPTESYIPPIPPQPGPSSLQTCPSPSEKSTSDTLTKEMDEKKISRTWAPILSPIPSSPPPLGQDALSSSSTVLYHCISYSPDGSEHSFNED